MNDELRKYIALQSKATPGPFIVGDQYTPRRTYDAVHDIEHIDKDGDICVLAECIMLDDATLFIAARNFPAEKILQRLEELEAENKRLRLERDVAALNLSDKETQVRVVMLDDEVLAVTWPENQAATDRLVKFPAWYKGETND